MVRVTELVGNRLSWLFIGLLSAALPLAALTITTVEDTPGRLILELRAPGAAIRAVGTVPGMNVVCPGCHPSTRPGAPDLPMYRFDVLAGPAAPTVTLQILESETVTVPEGIAPVPLTPTPTTVEYHVDPGMFQAAASASARILDRRVLRGAPVLGIEAPLALWSEKGAVLTLIKRVRIQLDFPGTLPRPASKRLDAQSLKAVKNPGGGAYLYATPAATAVRGRGLAKVSADRDLLGDRFIRIKVGDNNIESFEEDKVYGLSFKDLAGARGMNGELNLGVKIRNLRLFTGPDDTLPRQVVNGSPSAGTLREIPIEVADRDNNGTFDGDDSIHFFGHGSSVWKRMDTVTARIRYEFSADPYSFDNFYYLDFSSLDGQDGGLRLQPSTPTSAAGSPLTSTYAYLHAERDLETSACDISGIKDEETGFDWYWYWKGPCGYSSPQMTLTAENLRREETATLPNLIQNGVDDSLFMGFFNYGPRGNAGYQVYYGGNGDTLQPYENPGSNGVWYVWTKSVKTPAVLELDKLDWNGSEKRFEGYTVCYRRKHVFSGQPIWIFPPETGKVLSYQVEGGSGVKCLRIENGVPTRMMLLDGDGIFTDSLATGSQAKYFVYRKSSSLSAQNLVAEGLPAAGTAIRNLGSGDGKNPEYLILTNRSLLAPALALRDYRNDPVRAFQVKTEVVLVEDIYRQFSGGRLSPPAIRDFLRYAYRGWGNQDQANKLKYVLLFGDGHYDYRNIRASLMPSTPPNIVPPYEFIFEGGSEGVATDDFYALLDAGDFGGNGGMLDLALGRVPVETASQATDYLKKVADFENPALAGEWRGRVVFAADDNLQRGATGDLDPIRDGHTTDSDVIGARISARQKGTTVDKVYLLDYPLNSAYHKPEAAQDLLSFINRGSLLVNYVGHGASNQWADEVLLQTNDAIARMRNEGRTPMVNAFSCTVGRFESLTSQGMSEQFVKQKGVGAIAAVSATRESFPRPNINLANSFYERLFPADSSGLMVTAGDALRDAKNSSETGGENLNDSKYQLLGEPVLLLRKPQLNITLTQVMDTIKALDCSIIKGKVAGGTGSGMVNIKIVAGSVHKVYKLASHDSQVVDKRGNILFERTVPYVNGEFSTDYFIPKQIAFGDTNAQVLVFAWDATREMEGTTARQNLIIQGTAQKCATDADGKGPRIRITGCEKKETGELDFPERVRLSLPYCLQIQVVDSIGGVLSAQGPDEGTTVEIPGAMEPFHPLPGIDELYTKTYQLSLDKRTLQPGTHLLKVSAHDGYGNLSLRQMRMDLTADSSVNALIARNVPNPMKRNGTTFYFATVVPTQDLEFGDPNAGKERLEYGIRIFNQAGNLVKTFEKAVNGETTWDGRDHWGNLMANGVYFYTVTSRQLQLDAGSKPDYGTSSSRRNTLVISR
ncbi:MAG: C25 family cysteine peptidase [Fibrobacteria bacterium]